MSFYQNKSFFPTILLAVSLATGSYADDTKLLNKQFPTGKCTSGEKQELLKIFKNDNLLTKTPKSYTISNTAVDSRRGSSPTTETTIPALKTLFCLAKSNNKILVAGESPLDKSCGWVKEESLATVSPPSGIATGIGRCGEIKPLSVGDFCSKVAGMNVKDLDTKLLLRGCSLTGVKDSTIDAKFVTDNTSARLSNASEAQELVRRKIPVYPTSDAKQPSGSVDVFSLTQVFGVEPKPGGKVSILLGLGSTINGWTDLDFGHIWYSNLTTYFDRGGNEKVYYGEITSATSSDQGQKFLASKPADPSFDSNSEYVKFPVLFDQRKQEDLGTATLVNFIPQLEIAFIGKFCKNNDANTMCANQTSNTNTKVKTKAADVVFLIDGSKSMSQYYKIVAESLTDYTSEFVGDPDYRFGVAMYGDFKSKERSTVGDPIDFDVVRKLEVNLVENFQVIEDAKLFTQDALFDKAEAVHAAVYEAANSFEWAPNTANVLIHIADHGDRDPPTQKVFNALLNHKILYVPIAVKGDEVLAVSQTFIDHSKIYARKYLNADGDQLAAAAIKTYGDAENQSPKTRIADALIEATRLLEIVEPSSNETNKGDIFAVLAPAIIKIFNLRTGDDVDMLASTGFIKTAAVGDVEKNWRYFINLDNTELDAVKKNMATVCNRLGGGGDSVKVIQNMALDLVITLTGDKKKPMEVLKMFAEGSIPLQTETIIGSAVRDFILTAEQGGNLEPYKKEFCRSYALIELMQKGEKVSNPYAAQDLIWAGTYFETKNEKDHNWLYSDTAGEEWYYLPVDYLPRSQSN